MYINIRCIMCHIYIADKLITHQQHDNFKASFGQMFNFIARILS